MMLKLVYFPDQNCTGLPAAGRRAGRTEEESATTCVLLAKRPAAGSAGTPNGTAMYKHHHTRSYYINTRECSKQRAFDHR